MDDGQFDGTGGTAPGTTAAGPVPVDVLVDAAAAVLAPRDVPATGARLSRVAAAVLAPDGRVFAGCSILMHCGLGFCAEHAAAAALVAAGGSEVAAVVAVRRGDDGDLEVLPPCGRCREFLAQLDPRNLSATVVLADGVVPLSELLPHRWQALPGDGPVAP